VHCAGKQDRRTIVSVGVVMPAGLSESAKVCLGFMLAAHKRGYQGEWAFGRSDRERILAIPELEARGLVTVKDEPLFPESVTVRLTQAARDLLTEVQEPSSR
jgi:hypothetical protein